MENCSCTNVWNLKAGHRIVPTKGWKWICPCRAHVSPSLWIKLAPINTCDFSFRHFTFGMNLDQTLTHWGQKPDVMGWLLKTFSVQCESDFSPVFLKPYTAISKVKQIPKRNVWCFNLGLILLTCHLIVSWSFCFQAHQSVKYGVSFHYKDNVSVTACGLKLNRFPRDHMSVKQILKKGICPG